LEYFFCLENGGSVFQKSRKNKTGPMAMGCDWYPLQGYSQLFNSPEKGTFVNA
jgi:hypothetical protein